MAAACYNFNVRRAVERDRNWTSNTKRKAA
jgi:hypothetical protein